MGESEHRATGDRAEAEDRAKDDPGGDHSGTADEPREGEEPERQQEARDADAQVETLEPDQG
jgi:hypothetical protein